MKFLALSLLLAISVTAIADEMSQYQPLVYENGIGIRAAPELLNREHLDNVVHVLSYYRVKCRRVASLKLLIDSSITHETQWNFTTKANDAQWLKEHPIELGAKCT
ncbi:hypothetical protein [Microbulbifer sp. PSTR4-B]|uniref:hypothetical protein n=1 Tax=unclassified Microbulbifer TaxID=2619833 RepID=UPI00403AE1F1